MTNKERVVASIDHRQPDKTPYCIGFTFKAYTKMVEFSGDPDFATKMDNCIHALGAHLPNGSKMAAPDVWQDEFGVQWDKSIDKDIGNVCNYVVTPDTLKDYVFPDPSDPTRYAGYDAEILRNADKYVVCNVGFSLFERAWTMAGMENVLMGMADNPAFVHRLLDRILDFNLKIIEHACAHRIDGMMFGDDWGQQTGLIMGPQLWRAFIKPRLKQMYGLVKSKGKHVLIHSCGKVDDILPDLIEVGVDVFNPFQPEVMDVYKVKERYGDRLSFWGGISTQKTLPFGTVQQVKDETRRLLDKIGRNGGYIAAPAHSIPGDAKPENIVAMLEVLNNQ